MRATPAQIAELERKGLIAPEMPPAPPLDCSESEFDSAIMKLIRRFGWRSHHHYDPRKSEPGWFDRVIARHGVVLFVELKTETGELSKDQLWWYTQFVHAGLRAYVWRPSMWGEIVEMLR